MGKHLTKTGIAGYGLLLAPQAYLYGRSPMHGLRLRRMAWRLPRWRPGAAAAVPLISM